MQPASTHAQQSRLFLQKAFDVKMTTDVRYGSAGVEYAPGRGPARYRATCLDVYEPAAGGGAARPALIMAFGGAFVRGVERRRSLCR